MAKSGTFKLWLVNHASFNQYYWGEGSMFAVGTYLKDYFDQVCKHASSAFANSDYFWTDSTGGRAAHDLVLHFFSSSRRGLITGRYNQVPVHQGHSGGTWKSPSGMISEVYLEMMEGDRDYCRLVANIAFHELMHNKLDADPQNLTVSDIHSLGGLAGVTVARGTQLSANNIAKMASALSKKVTQHG